MQFGQLKRREFITRRPLAPSRVCPFWSSQRLTNPAQLAIVQCGAGGRGMQFDQLKRREFITLVGGAAVAWPRAARTQLARKTPTVGYLWHAGTPQEESPYYGAVLDGFIKLGYVDGRNIRLEHRFPNEVPERFKDMAAELVAINPDVLMGGSIATPYLKAATTTIPIVFMFVPDPIGMGLVDSLAQPGGNITGL